MGVPSLTTLSFLSWSLGISRRSPNACIVPIYFCQRGFYKDYEHHFSRKSLDYWDKFYKRHKSKVCVCVCVFFYFFFPSGVSVIMLLILVFSAILSLDLFFF